MRQTACTFAIPAVLLAAMSFAAGAAVGRARRANAGNGSELRALREALAAHAEDAVRLDHALRTPIGAAAAALELLETSGDDPVLQAQARQVIARQLSRMTALTETLRETAQRLGG